MRPSITTPKPDKRLDRMAKRRGHGVSIREVAQEFGTSKSSAHRALSKGYNKKAIRND
jgi:transposase